MYINRPNLSHGSLSGYNNPNKIILHHPEFYGTIERLNDIMRNMGYSMIGYNYYIRKDGSIWKGRPDNVQSANCYGQNTCSLGVCFEGNYDKDTSMPTKQFNLGVELVRYLMGKYNINEVNGHKAYYNTACPGRYFPLDKMLKAIKNNNLEEEFEVKNIVVYNNYVDKRAGEYLADYLKCPCIAGNIPFDYSKVENVYAVGAGEFTSYVKKHFGKGKDRWGVITDVLKFCGKM